MQAVVVVVEEMLAVGRVEAVETGEVVQVHRPLVQGSQGLQIQVAGVGAALVVRVRQVVRGL
jgi:hypothetical protein